MLFSQFLPWLLTPLLMVGATYVCCEGGEKIWERVTGHEEHDHHAVDGIGAALGWLVNTVASGAIGLVVGAVTVAAMQVLPFGHRAAVGDR